MSAFLDKKISNRRGNRAVILPKTKRHLALMGEGLKLARLRRGWSAENLAGRAGVSRGTLLAIEKGSPSVTMGHYAAVLFALGLDKDLVLLGSQDEEGRRLQDMNLTRRATQRKKKNGQHEG